MSGESDFDKQLREIREQRSQLSHKVAFGKASQETVDETYYDDGSLSGNSKNVEYSESIGDDVVEEPDSLQQRMTSRAASIYAPKEVFADIPMNESVDPFDGHRKLKIAEREDEYHARRRKRMLSPERSDPFAASSSLQASQSRSYAEVMMENELSKEEAELYRKLNEKERNKSTGTVNEAPLPSSSSSSSSSTTTSAMTARRRRWDMDAGIASTSSAPAHPSQLASSSSSSSSSLSSSNAARSEWEEPEPTKSSKGARWDNPEVDASATVSQTPRKRRWDETPVSNTPGSVTDSTLLPTASGSGSAGPSSQWDQTPARSSDVDATPGRARSRWDETPVSIGTNGLRTPLMSNGNATVYGNMGLMTPTPGRLAFPMTPEHMTALRLEREMDARNQPQSDHELDSILPSEGFTILDPPSTYVPIRTPARKLLMTPTPYGGSGGFGHSGSEGFSIGPSGIAVHGFQSHLLEAGTSDLPMLKPEDYQYFAKLMDNKPDEELQVEEIKERKIMRLLLKIKNGTPQMRKSALRQITERARDLGAGLLFDKILPLLMSPSLEDQERHLLVKVIDRILYKLDDLVRPYVHKILVVIEPLLIDEDYYTRVEGREIISNLSKAAGLATMIASMRPDIDHTDEYVRNTTARAFSVVASALGIPALLPFIKAVCNSKKSWAARHTGIKIVQQIAILMGCAVLPHLKSLVDCIASGLEDEQQKVRTITALSLSALGEAAAPYGIESFDSVLKPLWKGIRQHRSKALAAFLKAIGYIIPLMDAEYANYYTREVMVVLIREFQTPDEEMKKIVLKVVKQCVGTDGVTPAYIRSDILPEFFRHFWVRRMALDKRNYKQLVETTAELANRVGTAEVVGRIVLDLKDESEAYRKMVIEVIEKVIGALGVADVEARLEEQLIDGILFAFQEQTLEDPIVLNGFGTIVNSLGLRTKPYLQQICSTVLWRLNNKSAKVRQQAADLVSRIAGVMMVCHEEKLLGHLGIVLYEYLGEEYPEVLGSILGGLKAIVNVIGMNRMNPPIKDLLPRLTPILKNRHEKVQENCIDLVGRIADRGAESVSAREWMRICFELLDMLKAHKKAIRRAAVNTFGYIAKAIGPQDVLATLLNNLKVQERQNRVCTTVAIAIVAENCSPFTILPALMNEYRVPELNVQNGVLKSLSFLFEYIGEMGKDYIYAVTPLLEDALMDRDLVHRQTACTAVKHIALGVVGLGCEDALIHLLNYVWPNIFESSPHVINAVMDAVDGLRLALGPGVLFLYILQGLFHPARKVRDVFWKVYNNLYISHQDALVAFFPRIEFDNGKYEKRELDLWL